MTNWAEKATSNILHLSKADNLREALREWATTGGYEDSHNIEEICELCEHEGLRYQYEIENLTTRKILWVGSTCITKFIPLYENGREIIDEEAKANLLRRRQKENENNSRQERAFDLLNKLAQKHPDKFAQSAWCTNWKLGYSAKQLMMISVYCKQDGFTFNSADFRINTRRGRVLDQVSDLEYWQYRRLRAALPKSRRADFDAYFLK
jgi:hypothetical protein